MSVSLKNILRKYRELECEKVFFKYLAANDNSKNQVYLGGSFEVLQILPIKDIIHEAAGDWKRERFKADINFSWLEHKSLNSYEAPNSKLILYPKYPEVRFSGFLQKCKSAPGKWMMGRDTISDISILENGRILIIGVNKRANQSYGYLDLSGSELYRDLLPFKDLDTIGGALIQIPPSMFLTEYSEDQIFDDLKEIHLKGIIKGTKLSKEGIKKDYNARNGGGYTLEAELGISPNSEALPDYLGWEVKQIGVKSFEKPYSSIVTLMTPEPDGGVYHKDIYEFMNSYGYPDSKVEDRINFGGIFKYLIPASKTGLTLNIIGYDNSANKIRNTDGIIYLEDKEGGIASSWSFTKLLEHWSKKHNKSVYVPCIQSQKDNTRYYHYGDKYLVGKGTKFENFMKALINGFIYQDPALKYFPKKKGSARLKRRNQFRINSKNLRNLYDSFHFGKD